MERQREKRLRDVLEAASLIHAMIQEQALEGYLADEWFRAGVERKLELIGEALGYAQKDHRNVVEAPDVEWWKGA
jgi:uncharacterized protein with HEPN domain